MMKRWLAALLTASVLTSLTACAGGGETAPAPPQSPASSQPPPGGETPLPPAASGYDEHMVVSYAAVAMVEGVDYTQTISPSIFKRGLISNGSLSP